ncbi:hypothetical protein [Paludisphaera mucosa]|uniref:Serine hydrolase n=1 Tax=Paludisphaera mucosa TaxID=3030827 RepID=A0ABT6F3W3_9BACT|nr:hypothetical protein [Paludisphaera mucosa]MDG3002272.1 hypothetical protein [Paludisphaera mucosa]
MHRASREGADRLPPRRRRGATWLLVAAASASLAWGSGCIGPRSLELTRLRYDQAVHETSEQQWLRNIVRLRYGDLPSFLDVSAITSQFELSSRGSITGGKQRDSVNKTLFGDLALQFRDAPTLSYTPRDPTELTRTMVAPVGITALGLMANNGWSLDDVLRVVVAEVNGLDNVAGAELLIPDVVPPPTAFEELAHLAGRLRRDRLVALASIDLPDAVSPPIAADRVDGSDLVQAASQKLEYRPTENADELVLIRTEPAYRLTISPAAETHPDVQAFRRFLGLAPGRLDYAVRRGNVPGGVELRPLPEDRDSVTIQTRTLLDMLTFLSKGVRVPEEHLRRNLAAQTVGPDGEVFDWTAVTRGLFQVCVQKKRPKDAAVAIEYQGFWYFIPEADKRSKSTLGLIQALFNLQLSEPKKGGPLLTLPVGL